MRMFAAVIITVLYQLLSCIDAAVYALSSRDASEEESMDRHADWWGD